MASPAPRCVAQADGSNTHSSDASYYRYLLFGNRALTRVAWPQLPGAWQGGLWGRSDIAPAVFLLEVLMAYGC